MSAIDGVSEIFDPADWDEVPGFEDLTDLTYHRAKAHGTVRIAFDRPGVLKALPPHTGAAPLPHMGPAATRARELMRPRKGRSAPAPPVPRRRASSTRRSSRGCTSWSASGLSAS